MIGQIRGLLIESNGNQILVDVGGVGYEVEVTTSVAARQSGAHGEIALYTHFVVREDAQLLYGFGSKTERDVFRDLIRISGVGPKLALNLISSISLGELAESVRAGDVSLLVKVPGVGKKTAERLLVELKGRLTEFVTEKVAVTGQPETVAQRAAIREAEDALVALGYKVSEAQKAISIAAEELAGGNREAGTEALLRTALRHIARLVEVTN